MANDERWLSLSHTLYIKPTQEAESAERIELHFATMGKKIQLPTLSLILEAAC